MLKHYDTCTRDPHSVYQLHTATTPQPQHQVQGGLLGHVAVRQGAPILQLLAGEDEALVLRGYASIVT